MWQRGDIKNFFGGCGGRKESELTWLMALAQRAKTSFTLPPSWDSIKWLSSARSLRPPNKNRRISHAAIHIKHCSTLTCMEMQRMWSSSFTHTRKVFSLLWKMPRPSGQSERLIQYMMINQRNFLERHYQSSWTCQSKKWEWGKSTYLWQLHS